MNWKVGQKIAALCTVCIYNHDGTLAENVIEFDNTYQISSIESSCCMSLLDLGKTYNGKGTALFYLCKKCKKKHFFKESETILFDEKWFRPIDENESNAAKAVRKITNLISKKKKPDGYFIKIKTRIPAPPPILEPEPTPIIEPKREVEVEPEWEEELV
jgi:hypothetical protein